MNIPLIPDLNNPKWLIMQEILNSIDSNRARKIASRLKIPDVHVLALRYYVWVLIYQHSK
jgi:hypothetical protein